MKNIFSVDLEDWYQLACRRLTGKLPGSRADCVDRQLDILLPLLARHKTKATFFVLGMLARSAPALVKKVAADGHEIACHGDHHNLVYRMSPKEFEDDTRSAKELLEDFAGAPVRGYRAAEFSIRQQSLWALDVLAELGFDYDSSIFPIRHRRYGIKGFERRPRRYEVNGGHSIVELPPSTLQFGSTRVPVAGGGYFRLMPLAALVASVERLNRAGLPLITYFHPYEFDTEPLNVFRTLRGGTGQQRLWGRLFNFHQNLGRTTMAGKLACLLEKFKFTTCLEYLNEVGALESRGLFSAHGD